MKTFDISIQLDPVEDGVAVILQKQVKRKDKVALIIGTNGEHRIAEEAEAYVILDRLSVNCISEFVGKTEYLMVYNAKKVINTGEGRYVVGSVMIVKGTEKGVGFLSKEEAEEAKAEFESRLVTLCGGGIQFSAYEIG